MNESTAALEQILADAVEIAAATEREAFVERACAGNAALRARVERLVEVHFCAGSFLGQPAAVLEAGTLSAADEAPGTQIGPYKLLEQIGEGGMGVVFVAEQLQPLRRTVALKLIKPGMDSKHVIARFEAERQTLALMDHPNIARVLEAGTTDAGRPYFVMELVRGIPITEYCDKARLTIRQRLVVFVQVCRALQHAHIKGVIHRDLKPSNVLVTSHDGVPVPIVIDFGVAKALGQQLTERTLHTGFAQMIGTPLYMSPEQAEFNQLGVDTRSDIYSLGVLLYELLTGVTPFDGEQLKTAGYDEFRRILREEEPLRPSLRLSTLGKTLSTASERRGVDARKLTQILHGELDWIVHRALEKDRTRRYETASAFAADVERYLNDEQVEACPPSAVYRLRKFVRRNRRGLAIAGLLLFLIVLVGGSVGWRLRDRAAQEGETERAVSATLKEAEQAQSERKVPEALAKAKQAAAILASGASTRALEQRVQKRLADLKFVADLEELRAQRAEMRTMLVHGSYPYAQADPNYEKAFRAFGVDVFSGSPDEAGQRLREGTVAVELAAVLDDWAYVARVAPGADVTRWKRLLAVARAADPDAVRTQVREGLEADNVEVLKTLAATIQAREAPAATMAVIGYALANKEAYDEAALLLRQAQRRYPADFWINYILARTLTQRKPPQYEEAIRYYTAAVVLRPDFAVTHGGLGNALGKSGRGEEGVAELQEALRLKPDYMQAFWDLERMLLDNGRLDDAITFAQEAIRSNHNAGVAYNFLGKAFLAKGQVDEAVAADRKALNLEPDNAEAHLDLGLAFETKGLIKEAIDEYRLNIGLKPDSIEWSYNRLAWVLMTTSDQRFRDTQKAVELAKKCLALQPGRTEFLSALGYAYYRNGEWEAAKEMLNRAIKSRARGANSRMLFFLAMTHWQLGAKDEARTEFRMGVERMTKLTWNESPVLPVRAEAAALLGLSDDPTQPTK